MDLKSLRDQINQGKTFSTTIPSMGIEVFGKPYTLEDAITMAGLYEMEDSRYFYAGLINLISVKYTLLPDISSNLTNIDVQWLMIQLKRYSDGDVVPVSFQCPHQDCGASLSAEVHLDEIHVANAEGFKKIIDVNDTLKIEVGQPSCEDFFQLLSEFKEIENGDEAPKYTEKNIKLFEMSIKKIHNGDEVQVITPEIRKDPEFHEMVVKDLRKQYYIFQDYLTSEIPVLVYDRKIMCPNCKKEVGINADDFFLSVL